MFRSISKMAIVLMTVLCIVITSALSASSSAIIDYDVSDESELQALNENATQTISSGEYFIKNRYSGKYMTYSGVNVAQYSRSNNVTMQNQRWNVVYNGIDIIGNYCSISGAEIIAPTSGVVVTRRSADAEGGNMVVIETDNYTVDGKPLRVAFLHMLDNSCPLSLGDNVEAGDPIGRVGNTGDSYGAHLHLSTFSSDSPVWPNATTAINPQRFFKYVSFTGDRSTLLNYTEEEYE